MVIRIADKPTLDKVLEALKGADGEVVNVGKNVVTLVNFSEDAKTALDNILSNIDEKQNTNYPIISNTQANTVTLITNMTDFRTGMDTHFEELSEQEGTHYSDIMSRLLTLDTILGFLSSINKQVLTRSTVDIYDLIQNGILDTTTGGNTSLKKIILDLTNTVDTYQQKNLPIISGAKDNTDNIKTGVDNLKSSLSATIERNDDGSISSMSYTSGTTADVVCSTLKLLTELSSSVKSSLEEIKTTLNEIKTLVSQ